jgi:hypothetical protein
MAPVAQAITVSLGELMQGAQRAWLAWCLLFEAPDADG